MSGASSNQRKQKNATGLNKKSKFSNATDAIPLNKVLQVKSVKLDTKRAARCSASRNSGARSEDNLRTNNNSEAVPNGRENGDVSELEASIVRKIKKLTLNNAEGESCAPSTSASTLPPQNTDPHDENTDTGIVHPENEDSSDNFEQYAYGYKQYFQKNNKSIKFTNQVTVLYFNGEDILCESMEPLKKEIEQQLRNKEMRKEHLMSRGQVDNVYLF